MFGARNRTPRNGRKPVRKNPTPSRRYRFVPFSKTSPVRRSLSVRRTGHDESQLRGRVRLFNGRFWTDARVPVFLDIHIDTQTVAGGYNMFEFRQIRGRGIRRRVRFLGPRSENGRGLVYS